MLLPVYADDLADAMFTAGESNANWSLSQCVLLFLQIWQLVGSGGCSGCCGCCGSLSGSGTAADRREEEEEEATVESSAAAAAEDADAQSLPGEEEEKWYQKRQMVFQE